MDDEPLALPVVPSAVLATPSGLWSVCGTHDISFSSMDIITFVDFFFAMTTTEHFFFNFYYHLISRHLPAKYR